MPTTSIHKLIAITNTHTHVPIVAVTICLNITFSALPNAPIIAVVSDSMETSDVANETALVASTVGFLLLA